MSKIETEEIVAVEFVNREKHIINFVKDEHTAGFFFYGPQLKNPRIGDLLKIKFAPKTGDDKFYKAIHIQPAGPNDHCPAVKSFKGEISITNKNGFGFVDEIFIFPQLVKKFNLSNQQTVEGKAIYAFDKKKNSWGWKAFELST